MEQLYTKFLETIVCAKEPEVLLIDSFLVFFELFKKKNVNRIQIWESIPEPKENSIYYEYCSDEPLSMLKFRVPVLPEDTKKNLENDTIWEFENITLEALSRFNINSLIACEVCFNEKNNTFLVLASKNKNLNFTLEEKKLLLKLKKLLEKEYLKTEKQYKSNDEIKRLQDQNNHLREQDRLRVNLINNISHELRTPLASILGFSNMLVTKQLDAFLVKDVAEQIHQAAKRLSTLITDFLHINKADSEGWSLNLEMCDIGELIKQSIEEFSRLYKEYKITYHILENYSIIKTDPRLIRQVLDNLVSNAIKYSLVGSSIIVTLDITQDNKELKISVTDQGIGINKEELSKIFDRFYRSSNPEVQKVTGSGLGLAICKEIIVALNGKIEAESELNKGSKFSFTLPITEPSIGLV